MDADNLPLDPFGIARSFFKIYNSWMYNGPGLLSMTSKLNTSLQSTGVEEVLPILMQSDPAKVFSKDLETSLLGMVRSYSKVAQKVHSAYAGWLRDYVANADGIPEKEKQRSVFWANQLINALSPANCFWTNPSVVQKFVRTKGESAVNGYENWLEDAQRGSMVRIADTDAFKVGENLAVTPGQVIFRNRLMELIQYTPRTETTYSIPIVFIQPWVNKFYILDLTEEKSLVSYLLNHGFTVFITSWKNPTPEMRDVTFQDYMLRGALKAVEVAREVCNAKQVHAAGYCIGGTTLTTLLAYLNRSQQSESNPIRDFTLFATMVDYSSPGELDVYITEEVIELIERVTSKQGYLDKTYLSAAFRLLRSNNLIWRYYIHNYLNGEVPPKSDFLYWNHDSTRLPAAMCTYFLREFYLNNNLVKEDKVVLGNRPINLRRITQPLYVVGAEQDHICPWQETFKVCNLVSGPVRYALADEGHITGIVNPPSSRSKRRHWVSDIKERNTGDEWLSSQQAQPGSWWIDWVRWLSEQSDSKGAPPPMGSENYPPLGKAPGSYVLEQ